MEARGPIAVVGAGKAAVGMAAAVEAKFAEIGVRGVVVAPDSGRQLDHIEVLAGDHPVPGAKSEVAGERVIDFLSHVSEEIVLCLISGGASSLMVAPIAPIVLADKQEITQRLLATGASIAEVNTVRKHLSRIKGGRLLRLARRRPVFSILISDVIGDAVEVIGSGPSVPDSTSFADAIGRLEFYGLWNECAESVRQVLTRGRAGDLEETVRPDDEVARLADWIVAGSNAVSLAAAAVKARELGYRVEVRDEPLAGPTAPAALNWIRGVQEDSQAGPVCHLAGGETTVAVTGDGVGGRNQEFALALVESLAGSDLAVLSAGTDGIDGPTDAAGAFVSGRSADRAAQVRLDAGALLRENDSYRFFGALGDLFRCGPTGTNVMDVKIALRPAV